MSKEQTEELDVAQGIEDTGEDSVSDSEDTSQSWDFYDGSGDDDAAGDDTLEATAADGAEDSSEATTDKEPPQETAETKSTEEPPAQVETKPEPPKPAEQQAQPPQEAPPPVQEAAPATPDWAERRTEWVNKLSSELYAMSDDEFANITQDPKEFAAAAARLHMNVLESAVVAVRDALPQYIDAHFNSQKQVTSAEEAFYAKWPNLKGHEQMIRTYGPAWSQANPKATLEERIEGIGQLVSSIVGTAPMTPPETTPPPAAPPHVGVSALGGAAAPPRVPTTAEDMWAQVDEELFANE